MCKVSRGSRGNCSESMWPCQNMIHGQNYLHNAYWTPKLWASAIKMVLYLYLPLQIHDTCANSNHALLLSKMYASQIISYVTSSLPNWFRTHCSAHRAQPSPGRNIASHICSLHMCLQSHISPVLLGAYLHYLQSSPNTNMWAAVVWLSACQCGPTTYKQIVAMWNFRVIQSL